jgi:hypothetical protein
MGGEHEVMLESSKSYHKNYMLKIADIIKKRIGLQKGVL